jgi:hypothetical protein
VFELPLPGERVFLDRGIGVRALHSREDGPELRRVDQVMQSPKAQMKLAPES